MQLIRPDWPAPAHIQALTTTREGGVSAAPYDRCNLAMHVGDRAADVAVNRQRVHSALALPAEPLWLSQVHGDQVIEATQAAPGSTADGSYTNATGVVCAVLTADCLPVLLTDRAGSCVAAVHAGWRGLAAGVIEAAVRALPAAPGELLAWLGPAIGPDAFEVGTEVRQAFVEFDPEAARAFRSRGDKWLADIYQLARLRLAAVGVNAVFGGGDCTFTDRDRFYSYRRDGRTGRMASLIWIT